MTLSIDSIPQPLQNIGPQVFVVISNGCVYYFRNEYSTSASGKFSLYGYNTVHRADDISDSESKWAFRIIHTHAEEFKTYYFAASAEKEMKEWMRFIKAELVQANGQKGREENYYYTYRSIGAEVKEIEEDLTSLTYQDIETDIYDDSSKFRRPKNYGENKEVKRKDEASDDEDLPDDNRISNASTVSGSSTSSGYASEDLGRRPPAPLPDVPPRIPERPGATNQPAARRKKEKKKKQKSIEKPTSVPSLPANLVDEVTKKAREKLTMSDEQRQGVGISKGGKTKGSKSIPDPEPEADEPEPKTKTEAADEQSEEIDDEEYWESIYFRDPNNERASEVIREIGEDGVYLIREGGGGGQVLVVFANNMPKKYKVQKSDGQYFLGRDGPHCDTLEELLFEYYSIDLPTVKVKLTLPYKLHQKYKMLPKSS